MAIDLSAVYRARDYIRRTSDPKYLEIILQEHLSIINTPVIGTCDNFQLPSNQKKNRRLDCPCWDISRVVLKSNRGSDYINASYVRGHDLSYKFIATQDPMPRTFNEFWSMVWQENSRVIVMLNGTKQKPAHTGQYVPSEQDHLILNEFLIKEESIRVKPQYVDTTLTIVHKETGESRAIHHFKYLDWPETGVVDPQLFLDFLLEVNKQDQQYFMEALQTSRPLPGPIVVQGEAGVGRTSAFIIVDMCLYQLIHTASVSIPLTMMKVRQQRNFSIQTPNHYIFINNVILFFLVTIRSNVSMFLEFRSHWTKKDVHMLSLDQAPLGT